MRALAIACLLSLIIGRAAEASCPPCQNERCALGHCICIQDPTPGCLIPPSKADYCLHCCKGQKVNWVDIQEYGDVMAGLKYSALCQGDYGVHAGHCSRAELKGVPTACR
jgi:hypothetical protein